MTAEGRNLDPGEVARFAALAARWWDPAGEMGALHAINAPRTDWIAARTTLHGRRVADIGCGGGLLSEALARRGAVVTAIDAAAASIEVARLHALETGVGPIDYRCVLAEDLAATEPGAFDVVTCLEMLEHVPDPAAVVLAAARLLGPGGDLFVSTIARTPAAWLLAVVAAEYALGLVPRGTHDYGRFIRPSELAAAVRDAGLEVVEITAMHFNPLTRAVRFGGRPEVNYLLHARRPPDRDACGTGAVT